MAIRLIAIDLDGTTLLSDRHTFTPRLTRALEQAHARGIRIVPVTGRQHQLLPPPVACRPEWLNLAVLCNGSQIRRLDTDEVLCHYLISPKALRDLLELTRAMDLSIEFSIDSVLHYTSHSLQLQQGHEYLEFHRGILANTGKMVDSLEPLCDQPVEKVNLAYIHESLHPAVEEALGKLDISFVWCGDTCIEITHPLATKGNGLEQISRLTGIPTAEMMALGDSGNDESMLRAAGLGVAMGNSPQWVKDAADAVTETNDNDGAAIAIERYVLNP